MHSTALRIPHNLGPFAAFLIVIAVGVISYLDDQAYKNASAAAEQSRTIVAQIQELLSQLKDAETQQRGFLLTGDSHYIAPYQEALPQIRKLVSDLGRSELRYVDATDAANLPALVNQRLTQFAIAIDTRSRGGVEAAAALVATNLGTQTMDRIRGSAGRVIDAENREFHARAAAAEAHANLTRLIILLGTIFVASLLLASTVQVNRLFRAQDQLILDLGRAREQEARGKATFETTLRSIGDALIATDGAGQVQFMNPIAEALTGWTARAAVGSKLPEVFRVVNESTGQPVENPAEIVLREGSMVGLANHTLLLSKDGREIPIDDSGAPIRNEFGATAGVVLVFRDVTERRRAQQQLEESELRYRLLFDSNPEAMWVFDAESLTFLMVNNAAIERYGYSREEFLGMTLRDIRPAEDVALLEADIRKGGTGLRADGPWRHRKKDGTIFFVEITVHAITLGSMNGRLVIAKDVTEHRRLEEQLRQSQKLEAVGHLAGGIAHDFNNLLTVIEGYAEMLDAAQTENSPQRGAIQEILIASQRAAALTQQLLAFSRRQVLQPQRLNLNTLISRTQKMLGRLLGEDIRIVTAPAPDLDDISADPGQMDQIILNLAVNARDAMEHGGSLTIETCNVNFTEVDAARHLGMAPGHYVRLSITDTGHGMDEETRRHIFEPFFTTKEPGRGTGLGLSTVYGIVKQSSGTISVYSEPGRGTTFTIYLPILAHAGPDVPKESTPPPSGRAGEVVLVVEDDETVRRLVTAMLSNLGYTVPQANTPDEALRLCADPSFRIDLLLTDLVLPLRDGTAIAQQAALHRPALKVLYMSGYTEHAVLRRKVFDHRTPFLQKPFTQSLLANKVRETLDAL